MGKPVGVRIYSAFIGDCQRYIAGSDGLNWVVPHMTGGFTVRQGMQIDGERGYRIGFRRNDSVRLMTI